VQGSDTVKEGAGLMKIVVSRTKTKSGQEAASNTVKAGTSNVATTISGNEKSD